MDFDFDVVSNPDFLTEGNAIKNFMKPDRIILGVDNERSRKAMDTLYHPIKFKYFPMIYTDSTTAEMIKYAATSMLATRVSFMNEIANLCEIVGADINTVRHGVGTDSRIGSKYIYPGCGYGGTLFPKDINDLINIGEKNGYSMEVLKAVDKVNQNQKKRLFEKFSDYYGGDIKGKTVALWGLSFKPNTDDIRESPAITTIDMLLQAGCHVRVYDPVAMNAIKFRWNDIYCALDIYDAVNKADAVMLVTEWRQFRVPSWDKVKEAMNTPLVIDGRNIYDAQDLENMGFTYYCIGKEGAFIMSKAGPVFKAAYIQSESKKILVNGNMYIIKLDDQINPIFLKAFIESEEGQTQLRNLCVGTTLPTISANSIKDLIIPLPDIDTQNTIAKQYSETLDEIKSLKEKLRKANEDRMRICKWSE